MSRYAANLNYLLHRHNVAAADLAQQLGIRDLSHPLPDQLAAVAAHFHITPNLLLGELLEEKENLRNRDIKLLVMDIDGVMTDGGMYYTESGDEFKKFNAKDGFAVRALGKRGVKTGIISHGFNTKLIESRAMRLHISLIEVSQVPKLDTLSRWCSELGITPAQVCFIGDDLNDEDIIRAVGFSACPADATAAVKEMVHVVLSRKGGDACVRELIDTYLLPQ
ncbi:MAG: HAD hydrolase family protein [Bacteroidetes bacterium]|nr:HAD hydrolase family protein [Bacteroidota bacterium]